MVAVRRLLAAGLLFALAIEGLALVSWLHLAVPELAGWLGLWGLLVGAAMAVVHHQIGRRRPPPGDDGDGGIRRPGDDPPPWWPQFEREFAAYVRRSAERVPAGR